MTAKTFEKPMARHIDPVCQMCRREGIKLYLKGSRCESPKCAIERRNQPPGMHSSPRQAERVRRTSARKAKAQTLLRRPGTPIPPLFRAGLALDGKHRRGAVEHAGTPARQRRAPSRLRSVPRRRPAARSPMATSSSTASIATFPACSSRRATRCRQEPAAEHAAGQAQPAGPHRADPRFPGDHRCRAAGRQAHPAARPAATSIRA